MKHTNQHPTQCLSVEIDVTPDDHAVVAVVSMHEGRDSVHYTGSAKRQPGDSRDPQVGIKLAVSRALLALATDLAMSAQKTITERYGSE